MTRWTLLTFNTHCGVGPNRRDKKPYGLRHVLVDLANSLDLDVIVLQEVFVPDGEASEAALAAGDLGMHLAFHSFGRGVVEPWPHIKTPGAGHIGLAVLTKSPAVVNPPIELPSAPFDPVRHRAAINVTVSKGADELDVIALHTTSRLPIGPPRQLRALARQLPPAERPTVIAGDHNFWGPAVLACLPGWKRTVRGRTWPASHPHSQIDHILIPRSGALRAVAGNVLEPVGSDHLPIMAIMETP